MRDTSRAKRILLFTLASIAIIVSGIVFVLGGMVMNRVPKDQPVAVLPATTATPLPQVEHTPAETLEPAPVPVTPATTSSTTNAPQTAQATETTATQNTAPAEPAPAPQPVRRTGFRALISNLFGN